MTDIVEAVRGVGEAFDQLSNDNSEHADGIVVVTGSVKELDEVTQRNITVAEQSTQVAQELLAHASAMSEVLTAFKGSKVVHTGEAVESSPLQSVVPGGGSDAGAMAPVSAPGPATVEFF